MNLRGPATLPAPANVFGQERALESLAAFLDAAARGPTTLIVEGEVGAGKSSIWRAALAAARERGYTVLASRPAECEVALAFAGLGDLFDGLLEEPLANLPPPQYRALRVAVLLEDPEGLPPDQRAVSVAALGVVRSLAERGPLLIAVDDYGWIDPASARVLEFVLRRLETEPVGFLATLRSGENVPGLVRAGPDELAATVLRPSPLGPDALDALFRARLGESVPRPILREIAAASGGNPLFALEIGRAILRGEIRPRPGETLPVPRSLEELVGDRLAGLPSRTRELLFLASAMSEPTLDLLERASGGDVRVDLEPAVRAGLVEVDGNRLRFVHPIYASTVYHALPPAERRERHVQLAALVATSGERAQHLSLAAQGPDAAVAAALDGAARDAARRGAPDAAAELSEQAIGLTPSNDLGRTNRRRIDAAEYHFAAGDTGRARDILEALVTTLPSGTARADVLRRLAKVRYRNDSVAIAAEILTRALDETGGDAPLRAAIERDLAWAVILCGDVHDAADHAASALRQIESRPEDPLYPELVAASAFTDFLLGRGFDAARMREAVALEQATPEVPIEWRPSMILAMVERWCGDFSSARRHLVTLHEKTVDAGDETSLPFLLAQVAETEALAGDWDRAERFAKEAHALALQTSQEPIRASVLYAMALVEAHRGRADAARTAGREGLALAEKVGSVVAMIFNQGVLGFLELSLDDPAAAHERLGPLLAWRDVVGIREPAVLQFVPDEIEALVGLGDVAEAAEILAWYEADARRLDRTTAMLAAARCRGLLDAATGSASAAAEQLERVFAELAPRTPPFERARAQLALGTIQRRTRRRKAARTSLEAARDTFERLGAQMWTRKAERLLGGATPPADRTSKNLLTPAEQRVADLVATGATNQAAADRLFVSVRAVEVHLTSIYRKLGVASRTELAALMANRTSTPSPDSNVPAAEAAELAERDPGRTLDRAGPGPEAGVPRPRGGINS